MAKTPRGHIRKRGDRYEIAVPLGRDPITKRYRYAYEYAGNEHDAERKRDELLERVAEGREPDSKATVAALLHRWMQVADLALSTRVTHEGYIRRTLLPVLGDWPLRKLQRRVDVIDQLYAHLRRCSALCDGRPYVEHRDNKRGRARDGHDCRKAGCRPHQCHPMAPGSIRRLHSVLRTAFGYGVKWGWMDRNPAEHATPPRLPASDINPPDPAEAALLLDTALDEDPDFGAFLWLAMVTGARRGELCPIRWSDIGPDEQDLLVARAYVTRQGQKVIKDTKTHQRRRLSLDAVTVGILKELQGRRRTAAETAGVDFLEDGYVFTRDGFGEEPWLPDTVSQKFRRMRNGLGLACRLHDLRHYTATQLIAAGVDLRTVAGRLGHSGGGSTTLKVYAHWTRPADQHAAELLATQLQQQPDRKDTG